MRAALERRWYEARRPWLALVPLAWLFGIVVKLRRMAYARDWLARHRMPVPVLVVGNITVGGNGKTPLIVALIERLAARGRTVGVVSRGYGAHSDHYPLAVTADTPSYEAGDEPVMLARRCGAAVAVDPVRPRAARWLVDQAGVDFILSDDGLQHYALARDGEIAVIDARRGLGNGWLLPAGPLREPRSRLETVDLSLVHGPERDFWLEPSAAVSIMGDTQRELAAFANTPVHAVAGIGDPRRFFDMLRTIGLDIIEHPMPDHHRYEAKDIEFDDDRAVLMTDKDAVKCAHFADARHWRVPVDLRLSDDAESRVTALLDRLCARAPQREGGRA